MKYLNKTLQTLPFYVPLSAHKVDSFTVNVEKDVITANIKSFYSEEALKAHDSQSLSQMSIVLKGKPEGDALDWVYEQLVSEGEEPTDYYNYSGSFGHSERNTFAGGEIKVVSED